jgi:hypothetical protein
MSNHCFMKTKYTVSAQQKEQDLRDIVHNKFADLLEIRPHVCEGEICDWEVRFDDTHRFPVCLKTSEKIEFTHPHDFWSYWAQAVVEDELAIKYAAKMSDDEYPHQDIQPAPENHVTFRKFLETTIHHSPNWKKAIIEIEISHLPDELKNL